MTRDDNATEREGQTVRRAGTAKPAAASSVSSMDHTPWLLRLSESPVNYWAAYTVDFVLMLFFLAWDVFRLRVGAIAVVALFAAGLALWTFSEYAFHRWAYHMGLDISKKGHERHHEDPTASITMPFIITPLIFLPLQQIIATWFGVRGFSAFLSGWFLGYIAYGLFHHILHRYSFPFAWYRHLQSQHRVHHAVPDVNFGVTMRFWDRVFGTEFRPKRAPRTP